MSPCTRILITTCINNSFTKRRVFVVGSKQAVERDDVANILVPIVSVIGS